VSCQSAGNRAGRAGRAAGISSLSHRLGYLSGLMARQVEAAAHQAGQAVVSTTAPVLELVAPSEKQAMVGRTATGVMAGARLLAALSGRTGALGRFFPLWQKVRLVARASELASGAVGSGLAELSRQKAAGQVVVEKRALVFFKAKTPVTVWRSALTPLLNSRERLGRPTLTRNEGVMFRWGQQSWHRGTISFETPQGERTITHLQTLSTPARHYYFDRPLTDTQAVDLAAGARRPERLPGFAGQISRTESLAPAWAGVKHSIILARLHWGDK